MPTTIPFQATCTAVVPLAPAGATITLTVATGAAAGSFKAGQKYLVTLTPQP